ncbi:MAG: NAD-dependent epimerase/dehydratase family protein [Candidatus Pacebacteria bacterium]|nr:NAD-dependent epimerase/dehydratase family protein [Candidatus Paceibacterota bacterium]MBP9866842.1 NAD-dependent epimerase/dehydratase family protein [Candidatus Paceibacterota bacterium]
MQKTALVLGAGGFIGSHMVNRLKSEGYWVRGVDLKKPEYSNTQADNFQIFDLRSFTGMNQVMTAPHGKTFDEIYQFAADMGGAGFVFTGEHDADIMHNSCQINLNVLDIQQKMNNVFHCNTTKIFYSSSACMYPEHNQMDPENPNCSEVSAYPADPDSEYGWEKLFSERLYLAYNRNYEIPVRIARYHNIFGPEGTWDGGREKSPAAMCRKVAFLSGGGGEIEVWGDGEQTRSFLFIDECIEATRRLMQSDFIGPVNIGSEEMISINNLVAMVASIEKKSVSIKHIDGPLGVRGRNSDNSLYEEKIGWTVSQPLSVGIEKTYRWIQKQIEMKYT